MTMKEEIDYSVKFRNLVWKVLSTTDSSPATIAKAKDYFQGFAGAPQNFNFKLAYEELLEACIADLKSV